MNLLKETVHALNANNKKPSDVLWVGSYTFWFTWPEFERRADVEYDDGYGAAEVAQDLVVVTDDGWLERHEYDGSEGWVWKRYPRKPEAHGLPANLVGNMWGDLKKEGA